MTYLTNPKKQHSKHLCHVNMLYMSLHEIQSDMKRQLFALHIMRRVCGYGNFPCRGDSLPPSLSLSRTHTCTHTSVQSSANTWHIHKRQMFPRILLWLNEFLCIYYECAPHKLATILLDEIVLNGLPSARINFDTVGGTQWGSVMARFGPGPSLFMFTALTPQSRVDKLITQQSSQANMMGVETGSAVWTVGKTIGASGKTINDSRRLVF